MKIHLVLNSITVPYEEINGGRRERWDDDGFYCTRQLKCAWDDRWMLTHQLRGYTRRSSNSIVYFVPATYPGSTNIFVDAVEIEPFAGPVEGVNNKILDYDFAILTVCYKTITYNASTNDALRETLVTESLQASAEFLTLPNRKLYWDTEQENQLETDEAPGLLVKMFDWVYTLHQMPLISYDYLNAVGYINNAALTSPTLGLTFPAGTLLYNAPEMNREIADHETGAWELTCRFSYRREGWNYLPRAGYSTFQPVYDEVGAQAFFYPEGNLNLLMLDLT